MRALIPTCLVVFAAGCLGTVDNPLYDAGSNATGGSLDGSGSTQATTGSGLDAGPDGASTADGGGLDAGTTGVDAGDAGDACTKVPWYPDEDDDDRGFGPAVWSCERPDGGYVRDAGDPEPTCQTNDSDCTPPKLQCAGESGREICDEEDGCYRWKPFVMCLVGDEDICTGDGECVECTKDDHCGDDGVCTAQMTCVECQVEDDCEDDAAPLCEAGKCIQCREASDCGDDDGTPYCESQQCVECTSSTHCTAPGAEWCSGVNTCVACLVDSHCGADAPVCEDNQCVACATDTDCSDFPSTPVCDAAGSGACVECLPEAGKQALCTGSTPRCASGGTTCVECNNDSQCTDLAAARCAGNECVPCNPAPANGGGCAGLMREGRPAEVCAELEGAAVCVQCDDNADCGANALCTPRNYCVEGGAGSAGELCAPCYDDRQCPGGSACIAVEDPAAEVTPLGECLPVRNGSGECPLGYVVPETDPDVVGLETDHCRPRFAACEEMLVFREACSDTSEPLCVPRGPAGQWTVECDDVFDCEVPNVFNWECDPDLLPGGSGTAFGLCRECLPGPCP